MYRIACGCIYINLWWKILEAHAEMIRTSFGRSRLSELSSDRWTPASSRNTQWTRAGWFLCCVQAAAFSIYSSFYLVFIQLKGNQGMSASLAATMSRPSPRRTTRTPRANLGLATPSDCMHGLRAGACLDQKGIDDTLIKKLSIKFYSAKNKVHCYYTSDESHRWSHT